MRPGTMHAPHPSTPQRQADWLPLRMLSQLLPQEHRDVAVFIALVQHHAQILVRAAQVEPVRAGPQQPQFARAKVSQVRFDDGLDAVIHAADDQVAPRVRVVQRALTPAN